MALRPLTAELIDANYSTGVWQRRALYEVIDDHAERRPDALATADQHERLSYAEFARRTHALAGWLLDQGLQPGDAVAVQAPNRIALPLMHFACDRADLVYVPLSHAWRHTEMRHLLKTSKAKVLVVPEPINGFDYLQMISEIRDDLPDLELVGLLEGEGGDFDLHAVSTAETSQPVNLPRDPNAGRYVMVTSGTTDVPHMSLWTDNNLWFFMNQFIERIQMRQDDVAIGCCPANTGATGYVFAVLGPLLHGAGSVLLEHWDATEALDLIEAERATLATAVPTQVVKMLQDPSIAGRDFSSLRVFTNAGAAMPPHFAEEMEKVFGCFGHVCYGATDGGVPAMTSVTDPAEKRYRTVGRPTEFADVRLTDALGEDVPAGASGEILWRSPTKTFGYMNEPERSAAAFDSDGWYKSGDLGRLDDDGYLSVVGRVKDVIIRGGQNISPQEIEAVISQHPAIAEVSVIGIPDPVYGERVCACVVLRPATSLTLDELNDFLRGRQIAVFKLPERMESFEELPKSAGGKITKVALRGMVAQHLSTSST